MSDSVYTDFSTVRFASARSYASAKKTSSMTKAKKDKKILILKIIVLVLCLLIAVEVFLYTVIIPALVPAKIQFMGLKNLSPSYLTQKLNEMGAATWLQFDTDKAVGILGDISCIEKVTVDKHFPDKVYVQITERECVAKTLVSVNGRALSVQIDGNGVLFLPADEKAALADIPVITGLPIENAQSGMRLPARYRTLMEQIASISSLKQKYFEAISEIQVIPKEYGNYELVLYPMYTPVKVLTDRALNEDTLKYMMVLLDVVNSMEPDVTEIDLRYGALSYRRK